jgi:hypothetical protein
VERQSVVVEFAATRQARVREIPHDLVIFGEGLSRDALANFETWRVTRSA